MTTTANWPTVLDLLCKDISGSHLPADEAIFWAAGIACCKGLRVEASDSLMGVASRIDLCNDDESAWLFLRIVNGKLTADFDAQ